MNSIPKKFIRDFPLVLCQIWGCRYKYIFGKHVKAFPRNIFLLNDGLATLYRGSTVNAEINSILLSKLKRNKNFIRHLVREYLEKIHVLRKRCSSILSQQEFVDFLDLVLDCWQGFFISLYVPPDKRFTKEDRDAVMKFRKETGDLEYEAFNHIDTTLRQLYGNLGVLARYILLEEITKNKIPRKNILLKRQKEKLILVDDKMVNKFEFGKLQKKFNFQLEIEAILTDVPELKGQIACHGCVSGRVRILMRNQDISLLKKGEVLVTSMTVPTFLSAMERAIAFITNEGGITCHAAIVAREMGKPCIIGTKIATKVLKDGDMVEVDADKGVIRIIKKA